MKNLILTISFGFITASAQSTVWQSDGTPQSIQFLHDNSAQDGDTITLPAGTFNWTTKLVVTKGVTLQGAGVGQTIIKDGCANPNQFLEINLVNGKLTRVTGIEFQDGGRPADASDPQGALRVNGNTNAGTRLRFDHNFFNDVHGALQMDTVLGVIDHNTFVIRRPQIDIDDGHWDGDIFNKGDVSWAAVTGFGTEKFLFIEDNTFSLSSSVSPGITKGATDSFNGGRFVFRYNTGTNVGMQTHGTESDGRIRGHRASEWYNNNLTYTFQTKTGGIRSGVALFHDNTCNISTTQGLADLRSSSNDFPWGPADGSNQWDINDPTIYESGTASAGASRTLTDNTKNWTTNQWVGYTLRDSDVATPYGAEVQSNTATTITVLAGHDPGVNITYTAGHHYQLRKVLQSIDQPGVALGGLITGAPVNPPPPGWNDQVVDPCYAWNNTGFTGFSPESYIVRNGVHFFNAVAKPGYTPFTYPHPLVGPTPTPSPTPAPTP